MLDSAVFLSFLLAFIFVWPTEGKAQTKVETTTALNVSAVDFADCDRQAVGIKEGAAIGVVMPYANPAVTDYISKLGRERTHLVVCAENWSSILPRFVPWSKQLERGYGFVLFLMGFLALGTVLYIFTPRRWWHRTTLANVSLVLGGTWLLGILFMAVWHLAGAQRLSYGTVVSWQVVGQSPQWFDVNTARDLELALATKWSSNEAELASTPIQNLLPESNNTPTTPEPEGSYKVFQRLNMREMAGTQNDLLQIIERGNLVKYAGKRQEDWWLVTAPNGQQGWVSSLWLRK